MFGLRKKLQHAVQSVALGGVGALLGLVGLGFLSAAFWLYLAALGGAIMACAILGFGYLGIGLLLMMLASGEIHRPHDKAAATTKSDTDSVPPLATAFMQGVQQGMAARRQ